jgi:hypothetical protein
MYLEMAAEEDKKTAENWKDGADGILIFVRRYLPFLKLHHANSPVIDWAILRCRRVINFGLRSGSKTESAGHLQFLPRKYLSGYD